MKKLIFSFYAIFAIFSLSFAQNSSLGNFKESEYGKIHNQILEIIKSSGISISDNDGISKLLVEKLPSIDNRFNQDEIKNAISVLYKNESFQKNILSKEKNVLEFQNFTLNQLISSKIVSSNFQK